MCEYDDYRRRNVAEVEEYNTAEDLNEIPADPDNPSDPEDD